MFTLFKKEISSYFGSLTGYIVITVFLCTNSLFLWIFPGEYNVLDSGYSNLDTLFFIAPWIFLFLVPALTMRLFSEEKRSGTFEILYTKPISVMQIIISKYLAGVVLVLFSLIPTLIYFITVYYLGKPVGNIDIGATWGSFIGLFFLAAVYVAIGVFSSSLTENQIVSFLISMLLSFFIFIGFEAISSLNFFGNNGDIIENFGINAHYKSISRGIIDSRDVMYFVFVSTVFIFSTKIIIEKN